MRRRPDSCREVHVVADVAFLGHERRARVQADAQVDRAGLRVRRLSLCAAADRSWGGREGEEERVSLRVHLDAALGRAGVADDASVLGERLRVLLCAELVQELRRALDVSEEEGDGAGREIVSHAT